MHHFIFPSKTAWISSGSSNLTGESFRNQNFGKDQIFEIKKEFYNFSMNYQTRGLIEFNGDEFNKMSQSLVDGDITADAKFYLRLYEAEGNQDLSTEYKVLAQPLSQSWVEGRGKFSDEPKVTDGTSWENREFPDGGTAITWSNADGSQTQGGSVLSVSHSVQSFSDESPDIELDISDMTRAWLSGSDPQVLNGFNNNGLLLRFSGSQESNSSSFGHLKFFSRHTHTIYSPRLEVRWNDVSHSVGDNTLSELTMSGDVDNHLYIPNLKESYKEDEKVKFRIKPRKRYIQKTFDTSVQTLSGSYVPASSGSYSIIDVTTGEAIVPFSGYTSMSCDNTSNYFIQWLNGFHTDRVYKILLKVTYDDGQEIIHDNDFEFIVKR
tara:strand:- start:303 stop:1439 length:1137 start_codon:yes stop_codon:yes gene_type:complete